jgi:hypothetical protein
MRKWMILFLLLAGLLIIYVFILPKTKTIQENKPVSEKVQGEEELIKEGQEDVQLLKSTGQESEDEVKDFDELSAEDLKTIIDNQDEEFDLSPSKEDLIRMKKERIRPY